MRTLLLGLVLASLLPGLCVSVLLMALDYRVASEQREVATVMMARTLVEAVDARLDRARIVAQTLATAAAMRGEDLPSVHRRARELLELTGAGSNVVLSDAAGRQVLNTLRETGEPLPPHGNPDLLRRVFATGKPATSDLYVGGVLGRPVLSVDVPVFADGRVMYDLSVGMLPEDFNRILATPALPPSWVAAIFDSSGTIVARTHAPAQFVGQKGTAEYIERIRQAGEGTMRTTTREGIEVVSSFSRSPVTGWSVGIGIPRGELLGELQRSLAVLALGFGMLFVAGLALAWGTASRIAGSMRALIAPAAALGSGRPPRFERLHVREAAEVAHAIVEAAETLRRRDEANRDLARLARQDDLTGLQNRMSASERLRWEFVRLRRTGEPYTVLLMDIDHFKSINDTFGHDAGDEVLRTFVASLAGAFRESDFLARYGGEEFLALLPGVGVSGGVSTAEKVRARVAAAVFPAIGRTLTVSIGVAQARADDASEEEAVRRADAALYRAKQGGRNAVAAAP